MTHQGLPNPRQESQSTDLPLANAQNLPSQALDLAERLFDAARIGNTDLLVAALNHNPRISNLTNSKGDSLLMLDSYHGHVELTRILLHQYEADPNVLNLRGQSPLAGSVFKNEPEIIQLLLENGADPDLGTPCAEDCLEVFSMTDQYGRIFEEPRLQIKENPKEP